MRVQQRGAAFGPPFFMRYNHRVEHRNTNTSPSLLDNVPYLWWKIYLYTYLEPVILLIGRAAREARC
jgi:hypothetical protein